LGTATCGKVAVGTASKGIDTGAAGASTSARIAAAIVVT
jgi:hypothetical protein